MHYLGADIKNDLFPPEGPMENTVLPGDENKFFPTTKDPSHLQKQLGDPFSFSGMTTITEYRPWN